MHLLVVVAAVVVEVVGGASVVVVGGGKMLQLSPRKNVAEVAEPKSLPDKMSSPWTDTVKEPSPLSFELFMVNVWATFASTPTLWVMTVLYTFNVLMSCAATV